MTYDDLKRFELHDVLIRQNAFKDCAARILQVFDFHLMLNPGVGIMEMNEEQLRKLAADVLLMANELNRFGENIPDE